MILNRFLTRKGWRVVSHSMLAAAGTGLLYLLSGLVIESIRCGTLNWWVLGIPIALSLCSVVIGSILAKAEMTDWR